MNLKTKLTKHYINFRGWKTNRKIVVIESDDWGSIRMASKEVYNMLLSKNIPVDKSYFTKNDSLETDEDLLMLKETLSKVKDINDRHPIITFNAVVANPDYNKIIDSGYSEYFHEPIAYSYNKNINNSKGVLEMYHKAIKENEFFKPQFHGREHLNVRKLMKNLQEGNEYDLEALKVNSLLGLTKGKQIKSRKFYHNQNYMAGFEALDEQHKKEINDITEEGLKMFYELFGYYSKSFVAQSLIWGNHLLPVLENYNVEFIQGAQQFVPVGNGKLKVINNFSGSKTSYNKLLWRRNASFEPASNPNIDWADKCLKEIEIAFRWSAPAIINSHRVNFIGSINKSNRENSLIQLELLLKNIKNKWPEVEFFSSDEIGNIMKNI